MARIAGDEPSASGIAVISAEPLPRDARWSGVGGAVAERAAPEVAVRGWEVMASRPLSGREGEILRLASQGMANKEIGGLLYLSEQTVKNHMSRILRKLGANDRAHAVMLAIRQGML